MKHQPGGTKKSPNIVTFVKKKKVKKKKEEVSKQILRELEQELQYKLEEGQASKAESE